MKRSKKDLLELNDLLLLRQADRAGKRKEAGLQDFEIPESGSVFRQDIWSRALAALSAEQGSAEEIRKLYGGIMCLELPPEALKWWETLFAVVLHAPAEELERISSESKPVPDRMDINCIGAAAASIAKKEALEEKKRQKKREEEGQKRLQELQKKAESAHKNRADAERNLKMHRRSGGNRS